MTRSRDTDIDSRHSGPYTILYNDYDDCMTRIKINLLLRLYRQY